MSDISISINDHGLMRYFDRMPHKLDEAKRGMLEDGSTLFIREMSTYPPPPTNSTYTRTRTYGRSWNRGRVTKLSNGWSIRIGSSGQIAPYNRLVGDRDRQARVHRGRWRTAQTVVEQSASQVQRFADARIRAALAGA